ncbi:MAG: hypothetical protein WBN11_15930 [Eudoraea sp.]|uniref:hypothetical protein n=1 Tax=Eudoraea sp. TaxID=1979955 RepID=UPI003C707740
MNVSDFTYLLQYPDKGIDVNQTKELENVLESYPFFQAARALHLKGLKNQNSFKYNNALKITAAHTTDREILFDFITSEHFLQNSIADSILGKETTLLEKEIYAEDVIPNPDADIQLIEDSLDHPLPQSVKDADDILDPTLFTTKGKQEEKSEKQLIKNVEQELEIGKPLPFTKKEKHSFAEWLQITSFKPIERLPKEAKSPVNFKDEKIKEEAILKKKKFDLIDKFIENKPKIVPKEKVVAEVNLEDSNKLRNEELMTETLAKVYLEQKKFKKALQAYKILSLKYPEKSSFFASRIKAVKKLQQENKD